jgi:hypothetical protein
MPKSKGSSSDARTGLTSAQLRAQVLEQSLREPSPTRARLRLQQGGVLAFAILVPLLVFVAWGGIRVGPRPSGLVLQTALGSAVLAAGFAVVGLGRGRSMLGRPRSWLLAQVLLTPLLLLGWRVLFSARYPNMMTQWLDRPGLRCFTLSMILALAPVLALLWVRRGSDPMHPRLTGAVIGAVAGAFAWVLVDLWCPVGYVPHLLLGHVFPLLLLIALSALMGGRIVAIGKNTGALARR